MDGRDRGRARDEGKAPLPCWSFRGVFQREAGEALELGGGHFELEIEEGEITAAPQTEIGGHITSVIAQLGEGGQFYGPYAHLIETVQDGVVGIQGVEHGAFQFFPQRRTAMAVVILVLTVLAAELPVRTAGKRNLGATLKAAGPDVHIFEDVGHGTVFGKGVKTVRQFQAS